MSAILGFSIVLHLAVKRMAFILDLWIRWCRDWQADNRDSSAPFH